MLQAARASWGIDYGDVAVLNRTNAQMEPWEAACVAARVPYTVLGGFSFYSRTEVADVIAWMRVAFLEVDDVGLEVALDRIYNRPSRYLGKVWREQLDGEGGWRPFLQGVPMRFHLAYQARNADELREAIYALRRLPLAGASACDVVRHIVDGPLGYRSWAIKDGETSQITSEVDSLVSENLDAVIQGATRFPKLGDYLDFVDLCDARGPRRATGGSRVVLSTVHRAKGLEWPFVIVAGLCDGKLPHHLGMEDEERRLLYVAVTRAGDRVLLTGCAEPSRFLCELVGLPVLADPEPEPEPERIEWWDDEADDPPPEGDPGSAGDDGARQRGANVVPFRRPTARSG